MKLSALRSVLTVAAMLAMASTAGATSLTDLLNGQSMIVADKEFYDFTLTRNCSDPNPNACVPDANGTGIAVQGVNNFPQVGLEFDGLWRVRALPAGFTAGDWVLEYKVKVLDPDMVMTGMYLGFNAVVVGDFSVVSITEEVFDMANNLIINPLLFVTTNTGTFQDHRNFSAPQTEIRVRKDISLVAEGPCSNCRIVSAEFSIMDQLIDQERGGGQVPEPSTFALMGAGLVGFAVYRRRRA